MTGLPLNIDIQQILLHALNFVILFGGLYIILYKPVKDFMDSRLQHYKDMDEAADKIMQKSLEEKKLYEEKLSDADNYIADMKNKAAIEAKEAADKQIEAANEEAKKIIANANENIDRQKAQMLEDARKEVANLAADAAAKIIDNQDEFDSFLKSVK